MKRIISFLFFLLPVAVMAGNGNVHQEKARSFLEARLQKPVDISQLREVPISAPRMASKLKAYNREGGGFALMLRNDSQPVVIGYSDRGTFFEADMPEPMREWVENYALEGTTVKKAPLSLSYTPVAPLLTTAWGQNAPFNAMCPTYNDEHTKTGCSAVALAQILYYFRSNNTSQVVEEYVNSYTSTEISVDYSRGGYDWANMLPTYIEDSYTEQQVEAVARLMFEAGVACHCDYHSYSTSGSAPFVALQQHYNFKCNYYYRPFVTTEMWMKTIQQNLLDGRPIIYAGGNHAYVVDGIDADGLCHVNWGWAGLDDGYYDIAFSNPPSSSNGFVTNQRMIVDICPRAANEKYEERLVQVGTIVNNTFSAITTNSYANNSYHIGCGYFTTGEQVDQLAGVSWMNSSYSVSGSSITVKGSNGAVVRDGTNKTNLADGTYRMCLVTGDANEPDTWEIAYWPSAYMPTVTVQDGLFVKSDDEDTLYVHDLQAASDVYNQSYFYVLMEMELDKDVKGRETPTFPSLSFENVETGKIYTQSGSGVNSRVPTYYPGVKSKAIYRIKPVNADNGFTMPPGTYRMVLGESGTSLKWANATNQDFLITVENNPSYPILDVSTSSSDNYGIFGESAKAEIKVLSKNSYSQMETPKFSSPNLYSANNVGGNVTLNIYATREGENEEKFICSLPDFQVNANTNSDTSCNLPVNLYPMHGAYNFTFRYLTPDGERSLLNPQVLGHRVFVYGTNDYYSILEATSQVMSANGLVSPGDVQRLSLSVKNKATRNFAGKIKATFINKVTGELVQAESDNVSIASGQEGNVVFDVAFETEGTFDFYLDGVETGKSVGTAVLASDLQQRAHLVLNVGTSGIETISNSQAVVGKSKSGIYNMQGQRVAKPAQSGLYIVNGKKTVIRRR